MKLPGSDDATWAPLPSRQVSRSVTPQPGLPLNNDRCTVALAVRRKDLEKMLKALGWTPTSKASGKNHRVWAHPKREFALSISPNTSSFPMQWGNASSRMPENNHAHRSPQETRPVVGRRVRDRWRVHAGPFAHRSDGKPRRGRRATRKSRRFRSNGDGARETWSECIHGDRGAVRSRMACRRCTEVSTRAPRNVARGCREVARCCESKRVCELRAGRARTDSWQISRAT